MTEQAPPPEDERVKERAHGILAGREGHDIEDPEVAEVAAERILEDSEARTFDPATVDPEHDGVPRRTSEETA